MHLTLLIFQCTKLQMVLIVDCASVQVRRLSIVKMNKHVLFQYDDFAYKFNGSKLHIKTADLKTIFEMEITNNYEK